MAGLTKMTSVSIEFTFPSPRTIFATDDPNDVTGQKYQSALNPPLDLCQEVFAKVLDNVADPTKDVELMIDTDEIHIIRDPNFRVQGPAAPQGAPSATASKASKAPTKPKSGPNKP